MNFMQAVQAMKAGKKVTRERGDWYVMIPSGSYIHFKGWDDTEHGREQRVSIQDIESLDWEIVCEEYSRIEKQTLSDKRDFIVVKGEYPNETERGFYFEEYVKQAIKKFLGGGIFKNVPISEVQEKAKQIFGDELL